MNTLRVPIRLKLIILVSAVNVLSLGTVTLFSFYYFRREGERRIQEMNLALAELIANKISFEMEAVRVQSELVLDLGGQPAAQERFFAENPGIVLVGTEAGGRLVPAAENKAFLARAEITATDAVFQAEALARARKGQVVLFNASGALRVPLLGFAAQRRSGGVLGAFLDPGNFLRVFQSALLSSIYIVDPEGVVLAHPDSNAVLAATPLRDDPLVRLMMESKLDNGAVKYKDRDGTPRLGSFKKLPSGAGVIATVEEEKAFAEVTGMLRRNLLIAAIVLNGGFILAWFFARTLTSPLLRLAGAAGRIRDGDFSVRPQAESSDEVGVLAASFSDMARGLEEREKIKQTFGKFVDPAVAERAMKGDTSLGGVRRDAAVLFCDLRGFTTLAGGLEPEVLVKLLNEYFEAVVARIGAAGGVVDKFIGDAVLAHWGALGNSNRDDAVCAVEAALGIRDVIRILNEKRRATGLPLLAMGCGINYGPVLAGQIGSPNRMEFTVIGDTVNVASRMEGVNKELGTDILVSAGVYQRIKESMACVEMPARTVRGKDEEMTFFAVLGLVTDPSSPKNLDELKDRLRG